MNRMKTVMLLATLTAVLVWAGDTLGGQTGLLTALVFAGVMNFVIFPMFFASSALYPLWKIKESSLFLYQICAFNPFTHAVELVRFAFYGQLNGFALAYVAAALALFLGLAFYGYDPARGLIARKGQPDA